MLLELQPSPDSANVELDAPVEQLGLDNLGVCRGPGLRVDRRAQVLWHGGHQDTGRGSRGGV